MPVAPLVLLTALTACSGRGDRDAADSVPAVDTAPAPVELGDSTLQFTGELPRNLLLISMDTLRTDHVGALSESRSTPFLDSVLEDSVLHTDLRGCSNWTYSSALCLMSGQSMVDLRWEPVSDDTQAPDGPTQLDLLPLWLQQAGFETAVVTGSPWFSSEPGVLTGEGYDTVVYDDWDNPWEFPPASWSTGHGLEQAARLVDGDAERWFLQVHYMGPHTPYSAPAEYLTQLETMEAIPYDLTTPTGLQDAKSEFSSLSERGQALLLAHMKVHYSAEIRYMDDQLALLWAGLDAAGALDDTLVLLWTDHGEQFHEHKKWGHSAGLYQEENRALAGWWAPGLTPTRWDVPVQHQDLVHLIYKALQLAPEDSWTGQDPDTVSADRVRHAFRYNASDDAWFLTTQGDRAMVYRCDGRRSAFDVVDDPAELINTYDADDPAIQALWGPLDAELDRVLDYLPHLDCIDRGP